MTTSSTNNSVFRGFFEKQKLTGPNFIDWYRQLRIVLSIEDKLNYLEQPLPPAPVAPAGQHVAPKILAAHTAWKGKKHNKPQPSKAGRGQNQGNGKHKHAFAPKPKIPPPPKREDPAKDSICHECGETGHWKRNCPQYLAELLKKKKNTASGAGGGSDAGSKASRKLKPGALTYTWSNGQRELKKRIESCNRWDFSIQLTLGLLKNASLVCLERWQGNLTHINERAKDLLGLIHTDVCGPFKITSRQGASYFVTFTDDFSRYGYVYLLKHKHEVFETFKVFQKEVENQLGKTIKSLRSDRGGEYMSQEFLDHLKDHGIIAHRTPPYTPQHNGVSERRNRTLLDMVRSMMSQTTLPKSFWDYALETAARILNMVPTKKVEKTPYEVWHGQAPKLSYLKVWGCEALVKRDTRS
ncbi:retrotransposon protein, putative, ty1-copia subclass [Tanacetum coccineum]